MTPRFIAESLGEIVLELRLIITGRFALFRLYWRFSILLESTHNLFDNIYENTSLIKDSIVRKVDEVTSGKKTIQDKKSNVGRALLKSCGKVSKLLLLRTVTSYFSIEVTSNCN